MAANYIVCIRDNLDLLPAGYCLGEIERLSAKGREQAVVLRDAIQSLRSDYDIIFIDCPPTSGLSNFYALYAATEVILPVSSDHLALQGLSRLLRTIRSAERFMQKQLQLWIGITLFVTRRRPSSQVTEKLIKYFPDQLLATVFRERASVAESRSFGMSFFDYSRRSNGAKGYAALAEDILFRRLGK